MENQIFCALTRILRIVDLWHAGVRLCLQQCDKCDVSLIQMLVTTNRERVIISTSLLRGKKAHNWLLDTTRMLSNSHSRAFFLLKGM